MAQAVAKSRQLVGLAITSFTGVRESVCKVFPAQKHPTLSTYIFDEAIKVCREDWLTHCSRIDRQAFFDHLPHMLGIKPSTAKTVARSAPSFEQSKVDLKGALFTPAKKFCAATGFRTQNLSGRRSFSGVARAACSTKVKTPGPQLQLLRHVKSGRRLYYTDEQGFEHFKARGPRTWFRPPEGGYLTDRRVLIIAVLAGGSAYIYYTHLEVVPYTHRKHFVLLSPDAERQLGETQFENLKQQWSKQILPPFHPASVRVTRVAKGVIEAVMSAVGEEKEWAKLHHGLPGPLSPDQFFAHPGVGWETQAAHLQHSHGDVTEIYGTEEDLDDEWVERSRQEGLDKGQRGDLDHLKGMKWEIIVVDMDVLNAMCLPGGKIVVFTGLLKQFQSDAEIATVLGHEVGHAVARHVAEKLTQAVWLGFLKLTAVVFFNMPAIINDISELLVALPFSRRMEMEADHIGLVLMAAAGFNPVVAPSFYEKLGKFEKNPEYMEYLSTHPLGKRRAESLRNSETMKRAIVIYEERLQGHLNLRRYL